MHQHVQLLGPNAQLRSATQVHATTAGERVHWHLAYTCSLIGTLSQSV